MARLGGVVKESSKRLILDTFLEDATLRRFVRPSNIISLSRDGLYWGISNIAGVNKSKKEIKLTLGGVVEL